MLLALACAGCGLSGPAEFSLNTEGRAEEDVSLAQREAIREALTDLFGTPDDPRVPDGVHLDLDRLRAAAGPISSDEEGVQRGLFRQHCATCHGVTGNGLGPTASMHHPYPRDFRTGVFKYTSTVSGAKPVHEDLERTLLRGIPGTAMPSFTVLPQREIDALIEYVKYLSIRGETEAYLFQLVVDEDEPLPLGTVAMDIVLEDGAIAASQMWDLPEDARDVFVVQPPPPPPTNTPEALEASIERGFELYSSKDAQCVKCHGPHGAGDGEETEIYDVWNEAKKGVNPKETAQRAKLYSLPIQRLEARDFREGIFHGGSRPEDLYKRIYVGIKGTPMPAAGPQPGAQGPLTPEEIWDVVNYVLSLAEEGGGGKVVSRQ